MGGKGSLALIHSRPLMRKWENVSSRRLSLIKTKFSQKIEKKCMTDCKETDIENVGSVTVDWKQRSYRRLLYPDGCFCKYRCQK